MAYDINKISSGFGELGDALEKATQHPLTEGKQALRVKKFNSGHWVIEAISSEAGIEALQRDHAFINLRTREAKFTLYQVGKSLVPLILEARLPDINTFEGPKPPRERDRGMPR